jgi:ABC-type nitrate/sulfonate/bicarbonate transport system ATPase subunit
MRKATSAPAHPSAPLVNDQGAREVLAGRAISQRFTGADGKPLWALRDVTLGVNAGAFVSLIGPSGSGKSTLLNILAGLDAPTAGTVWLDEQETTPSERLGQIGLMPQRDLLLPWRTAIDNASAGLMVHGMPKREAQAQARALFARFGLSAFARAYPYALSGGMRQRVALVRSALAAGPVLLLDEPFGALDALTRAELHHWIIEAWQALSKTIILVTHDVNEALILSDRVFVLAARPGHVKSAITVDLPRPRDAAVQASPAFGALRQRLLDLLEVRA